MRVSLCSLCSLLLLALSLSALRAAALPRPPSARVCERVCERERMCVCVRGGAKSASLADSLSRWLRLGREKKKSKRDREREKESDNDEEDEQPTHVDLSQVAKEAQRLAKKQGDDALHENTDRRVRKPLFRAFSFSRYYKSRRVAAKEKRKGDREGEAVEVSETQTQTQTQTERKLTTDGLRRVLLLQRSLTVLPPLLHFLLKSKLARLLKTHADFAHNEQHQFLARLCFAVYLLLAQALHAIVRQRILRANDHSMLPAPASALPASLAALLPANVNANVNKPLPVSVMAYDLQENRRMRGLLLLDLLRVLFFFLVRGDYAALLFVPLGGLCRAVQHPLFLLHVLRVPAVGACKRPFPSALERVMAVLNVETETETVAKTKTTTEIETNEKESEKEATIKTIEESSASAAAGPKTDSAERTSEDEGESDIDRQDETLPEEEESDVNAEEESEAGEEYEWTEEEEGGAISDSEREPGAESVMEEAVKGAVEDEIEENESTAVDNERQEEEEEGEEQQEKNEEDRTREDKIEQEEVEARKEEREGEKEGVREDLRESDGELEITEGEIEDDLASQAQAHSGLDDSLREDDHAYEEQEEQEEQDGEREEQEEQQEEEQAHKQETEEMENHEEREEGEQQHEVASSDGGKGEGEEERQPEPELSEDIGMKKKEEKNVDAVGEEEAIQGDEIDSPDYSEEEDAGREYTDEELDALEKEIEALINQ